MEYIYGVMLLNKSGKEINEQNLTKVLEAAGVKVDATKVKSVIAALDGVDIEKVIEENSQIGMAPATSSSSNSGNEDNSAKKEDKKEDKKEEPAVDAGAGLGALFG